MGDSIRFANASTSTALLIAIAFSIGYCSPAAWGQSRFELIAPAGPGNSQAVLVGNSLRITDSRGKETVYERDTRYDSDDRQWLGFYSNRAKQILRWPTSGSGNLQIGQIQASGLVGFRPSQMTVRALNSVGSGLVLPPPNFGGPVGQEPIGGGVTGAPSAFFSNLWNDRPGQPTTMQLSMADDVGQLWALARISPNRLAMVQAPAGRYADWLVVPATRGLVRLQSYDSGRLSALAASPSRTLVLEPASQDVAQLWLVTPSTRVSGRYVFESAAYRGLALGGGQGNNFGLHPVAFAPHQMWLPIAPPIVAPIEPFWRTVTSEVRRNPPLEPAQLELSNTHRYAVIVLVGDRRSGDAFNQVRIEPKTQTTLTLDRDSGATLVETFEVRSPSGIWDQRQFVTQIPPTPIYDLSVYEEHLQSIAIDRTGTSPNPIEDVNYVPKSVGWLPIPPGDALPAVSRLDIYSVAQAAKNPGAVRQFDRKAFDKKPKSDPLEAILDDIKSKPAKPSKDRKKL